MCLVFVSTATPLPRTRNRAAAPREFFGCSNAGSCGGYTCARSRADIHAESFLPSTASVHAGIRSATTVALCVAVPLAASRCPAARRRTALRSRRGEQSLEAVAKDCSRRRTLLGLGAATAGASVGEVDAEAEQVGVGLPVQATNEVLDVIHGIKQKRLGGSDIVVSEIGLGTQRWCSTDFNAPNEVLCHAFMDRSILGSGVNLIDTAEQYPIPSSDDKLEGLTEEVIGRWLAKEPGRRRKVVIATKITGGFNVNASNIRADCEGSLRRLGTDFVDVYQLHWPARYSPQSNWGQSLTYQFDMEDVGGMGMEGASFDEICASMGQLIREGKIRSWGLCNDNAFGLTACCEVAKRLGVPQPVSFQGDFSLIDRKSEENGVFEASSPIHENVGFLAYNALAGGMLTGKYLGGPAAADTASAKAKEQRLAVPRGRHDDAAWGSTLYRYRSSAAQQAIRAYADLAKRYNVSLTELSLRWCRARRGCTSVLLGTSSMAQLEDDLRCFQVKEPLPKDLMWEVDRVHMRNRLPIFSSDRVESSWQGAGEIGERIP